jgi:predicted nucleic acid-binding protein
LNVQAAYIPGRVHAQLAATGKSISIADPRVAAAALVNESILVVRNVSHIGRIPRLLVERGVV